MRKVFYNMPKFCPEWESPLAYETSKFCDKCGAKTGISTPEVAISILTIPSKKLFTESFSDMLPGLRNFESLYSVLVAFFTFWILSVIGVYQDAKNMGAGTHSKKETMDSNTWSPGS